MKLTRLAAQLLLGALTLQGAPVLTLIPSSGFAGGAPGGVTGWGFSMVSDPNEWISFITSFPLTESNPGLGFYQDFIGLAGGPSGGVLEPGAPDWVQTFDALAGTGLGAYYLNPFALIGDTNTGTLMVIYERFSGDPATCGGCLLGQDELTANFEAAATPEPGTAPLVLMGVGLVVWGARRVRSANRGRRGVGSMREPCTLRAIPTRPLR
ncbi:MAG: PEP-CTERM sorting domain-containing protein [Bryobacterales bacterium]|nr:PEP-CTERM sorting domain-containing protein [Bryobacterales bacterium]